jgi:Cu/Ag efflux pump CusA
VEYAYPPRSPPGAHLGRVPGRRHAVGGSDTARCFSGGVFLWPAQAAPRLGQAFQLGILGLYVAGLNASVSAAVGFISLFGVSAMDGILLVSYIRRGIDEGRGSENAIIHAAETRMRQIFMTGFSACIGLVPAAVSTGIGSQVQQSLACVIVGGMLLSPFCSLLVIPTFARIFMAMVPRTGA